MGERVRRAGGAPAASSDTRSSTLAPNEVSFVRCVCFHVLILYNYSFFNKISDNSFPFDPSWDRFFNGADEIAC